MQWTNWGLIYAHISLLQMMDESCFLKVQRIGRGYDRNLTWQNRFEKWDILDITVML